jgi:hypothetical protein
MAAAAIPHFYPADIDCNHDKWNIDMKKIWQKTPLHIQ